MKLPGLAIVVLLVASAALRAAAQSPPPPDPLASGSQDGFLVGAAAVQGAHGAPNLRIPIDLPPGTAGLTPRLELVYAETSPRGGAGWLGFGWQLAGLSAIERDRKTGPPFDFDDLTCNGDRPCYLDAFVLDGTDLLCDASPCDGRYRTQTDDGRLIELLSSAAGWRVRDREGRTFFYGRSPASQILNDYNGQIFSWLLDRVEDASGNWMEVDYFQLIGTAYPKEIRYGSATDDESSPTRRVRFWLSTDSAGAPPYSCPSPTYQLTRPDTALWFNGGFEQRVDRRLASIEVRAGPTPGTAVKRYDFCYLQSGDSARSLLAEVRIVGSDGSTLPRPWSFTYTQSAHAFDSSPISLGVEGSFLTYCPPDGTPPNGICGRLIDLTGDALVDFLIADPSSGTTTWRVGNGSTLSAPISPSPVPDTLRFSDAIAQASPGPYPPSISGSLGGFAEMNGDGFVDFVASGMPDSWQVRLGPEFSTSLTWSGVEDWEWSWFDVNWQVASWNTAGTWSLGTVGLYDLNGDGRADRIVGRPAQPFAVWDVSLNRTDGSLGPVFAVLDPAVGNSWIDQTSNYYDSLLIDVNGDGLPDAVDDDWVTVVVPTNPRVVAYNLGARFTGKQASGLDYGSPSLLSCACSTQGCTGSCYGAQDFGYANELRTEYDSPTSLPRGFNPDFLDLNGDGFPDRLEKVGSQLQVLYGTGTGLRAGPSWNDPTASPWVRDTRESASAAEQVDLIDVNGDGLLDRVDDLSHVYLNQGFPDLLERATNPLGGWTEYSYGAAAMMRDEADQPANPGLPFPQIVVIRTARSDGRGSPLIVDEYEYRDAIYDRAEREFRGFGTTIRMALVPGSPPGTEVVESVEEATYSSTRACAGQMTSRTVKSGAGTVLRVEDRRYLEGSLPAGVPTSQQWAYCLPQRHLVREVEGETSVASQRASLTELQYGADPVGTYYNVGRVDEWGWIDPAYSIDSAAAVPDQGDDERFTTILYEAPAPGTHLVSRVSELRIDSSLGPGDLGTASHQKFFYELPSRPSLRTRTDAWLKSDTENRWITRWRVQYDSYGNPAIIDGPPTSDDPDGYQLAMTYEDVFHTFPDTIREGSTIEPFLISILFYSDCPSLDGALAGTLPAPPPGLGLPCQVLNPRKQAENLGYDGLGRRAYRQRRSSSYAATPDAPGLTETWDYDVLVAGDPGATETIYTATSRTPPPDPLLTPFSLTWRSSVDGLGREFRSESPGSANDLAPMLVDVNRSIVQVNRTFDARGRLVTEELPHFKSTLATPPSYPAETRTYDALGRLLARLDVDGTTLKTWTHIPGVVLEQVFLSASQTLTNKRETAVDGLTRATEISDYDPTGSSPQTPYKTISRYDAAGRLTEVWDPVAANPAQCPSGPACIQAEHVTRIKHDTLGRRYEVDDPDSGLWTYAFDDAGLLKQQINGAGRTLSFEYDRLRRVTEQIVGAPGEGSASFSFGYGSGGVDWGLLVDVEPIGDSTATSYHYEYDGFGRVMLRRQTTLGLVFETLNLYDDLDRAWMRTYPDGAAAGWVYDGLALRKAVVGMWVLRDAEYDALGRPVDLHLGERLDGGAPKHVARQQMDYLANGRLDKIRGFRTPYLGSEAQAMYNDLTVDGLGRVSLHLNGTSARTFGYDGLNRLKTATGPWQQPFGTTSNVTWGFQYDPLGNLRQLSGANGFARTWSYDDAVRPRFLTGFSETVPVGYTATTDTVSVEEPTPGQPLGGNPGVRLRNGQSKLFVWNAQNRLHTLRPTGGGDPFRNYYDASGKRTRQWIGVPDPESAPTSCTTTNIIYVGDDFEYDVCRQHAEKFAFVAGARIATVGSFYVPQSASSLPLWLWRGLPWFAAAAGSLVFLVGLAGLVAFPGALRVPFWLPGSGVALLIAAIVALPYSSRGGGGSTSGAAPFGSHQEPILFYLSDHLGSTRGIVDYWGNLVETRDYDPWGQTLVPPVPGSMQLKHRFTSQPFDMVAGLYNYGARMYDAKWGRFVSPDAIAEAPTSQGLNRYSYVSNTPTSLVDPSGERRQCGDFLVFCFMISGSSRGRINVSFSSGPLISGTFANQGPWSEQGVNVWSIPIDGGILDGGGAWSESWLRYSSDTHLDRIGEWARAILRLDWLADLIAQASEGEDHGLTNPFLQPWRHFRNPTSVRRDLEEAVYQQDPYAFGKGLHGLESGYAHKGFRWWLGGHVPYSAGVWVHNRVYVPIARALQLDVRPIDDPDIFTEGDPTDEGYKAEAQYWLQRYRDEPERQFWEEKGHDR